jgi:hypothetical protein
MGFECAIPAVTASFAELCELPKAWELRRGDGKDLFGS